MDGKSLGETFGEGLDHLLHLRTHDMGRDADDAVTANGEDR